MARCYVTYCRVYEGCQRPWPVLQCSLDCVKPNLTSTFTSFVCRSKDFFKSLKGLPRRISQTHHDGRPMQVNTLSVGAQALAALSTQVPLMTLFDYSNLICDIFLYCSSFTDRI